MQKKKFPSFKDASIYAKNHAQQTRSVVSLKRHGNNWVVVTGYKSRIEKLKENHELEEERFKLIIEKSRKRRSYLEDRKALYFSLAEDQLNEIWSERKKLGLQKDEEEMLRSILRVSRGVDPPSLSISLPCPKCRTITCKCPRK